MSSEAITQNDLREILSRTVGSVPSEYKKLLWTNPSPTSAFVGQFINLDLSNYDAIEIIATMYISNSISYREAFSGKVGDALVLSATIYGTSSDITRLCETSSTQVIINAGYAGTTLNNQAVIPYQIYGIKYERVAPPQLGVVPLQVATFQKNTSFVAGAGSLVFDTPLPEGAIIKSRCISRNPNAQWVYCGIHTVSATSTTVAYRNNFSSAFSGIMELSVFYEISN